MLQQRTEAGSARLLVVEDDEETREMLQTLLEGAGYSTLPASTGEDAFVFIEQEPIDMILLDVRLPGIDGYEVCRRIRAQTSTTIPILMMTANREPESVVQGLRMGADDYLAKPFASDVLLSRIEALLRRHRAAESLITENEALREVLERTKTALDSARTTSSTEGTLRREFLHSVTTHLRALNSVIEAEFRRAPLGPSREIVQRILGRVQGVALVYEMSEVLQEDPAHIDTLVHTIATALKHIYAPRRRLPLTIEGSSPPLPLAYAAPIAMIVNELVTNCFKHAFPNGRFGAITVGYEMREGEFCLWVVDDGVGMTDDPEDARRGQTTVRSLAHNLGGSATWGSRENGTGVMVRFPYGLSA